MLINTYLYMRRLKKIWGHDGYSTILLHQALKFSCNILQIKYQMIVLEHKEEMKYEATIGFLTIFYKQKIQPTSLLFVCKNVINLISQWKQLLL